MSKPDQSVQDDKITGLLNDETDARRSANVELRTDIRALQIRVTSLERELKENTELTEDISGDTKQLLDLFQTAKGGFKVVGWIGTFAKWSVGLAAGLVALYAAWQKVKGQ